MADLTYRFAFVLDQQVGLKTQALNWERVAAEDPTVEAAFIPVCYQAEAGLLARLPGLPSGLKGTLRGIQEIRAGLAEAGPREAVLWATWAAKSVPDLIRAAPSFLVMDMTPVQMEAMGERYGYGRARARFGAAWKRHATNRLYADARRLFPWNEWVAASLRDDYDVPAEKITPISPGVDQQLFQPDQSARPGDGVVRLLFVGGDFARKGGELLLRWARETQVTTPWELHLVTRDAVPSTPGITVHHGVANNSPQLVHLYQRCDLFVLPTLADCYSLVAMEAMSCGLPVVISRLGGISEIIADGQTGFGMEPDDYPALALRLDQLVSDAGLRQKMGLASLQRARDRFDCRANLGRILDVMKAERHT